MTDLADFVPAIIRLNGGSLVGKTRMQKTFYLLEQMDLGFGVDFDYHNYGPFSSELAFAADDAEDLGYLETKERLGYHEVPYTVFELNNLAPELPQGDPRTEKTQLALGNMKGYSSVILELAATAVYLRENGYPETFWDEVTLRKPLKASRKRIRLAKELLGKLGLD